MLRVEQLSDAHVSVWGLLLLLLRLMVCGWRTVPFMVCVRARVCVLDLDRRPIYPVQSSFLYAQVGLTYSGWFVYRYLLQEETREELKVLIDDLIGKTR